MTEYRTILERDLEQVSRPAGFTFEDLGRRRNRKHRNQRITAGVVGIAVFVAAVWIVRDVALLDRSETSVVPGGAGMTATTGPTATGPAATGSTAAADAVWNGYGLPPEGLAPSTPVEGEVVARFAKMHVGLILVYADGRVIWMKAATGSLYEQHLTPEGVDLVLSGAVEPATFLEGWYEVPDLPTGAWADPKIRPYVPARYAACFESYSDLRVVDPVGFVDRLPPAAREIFQGKERTYNREETPNGPANAEFTPARCFEVTTAEALAVAESLSEAGFKPEGPNREVWAMGLHPNGSRGQIMLIFTKLLPHGMWISWAG
jgi:hypothetical protein